MDLGIKNKVALVAASSRGLGKAIAFPFFHVIFYLSVPFDFQNWGLAHLHPFPIFSLSSK